MRLALGAVVLLSAFPGCGGQDSPNSSGGASPNPANSSQADRNAATAEDPLGESVSKIVYLDQGWSPSDSARFYFTSQGSQILPYDWFLVLEQANAQSLFRDDRNIARLRYLSQKPDSMNVDGLPVGFVKDEGRDRPWLGLSCAACHTGQVNHGGVGYRIDGAPSAADVRGFLVGLTEALQATRDQPEKFERFAAKVLGGANDAARRATLKEQLAVIINRRAGYNTRNFPTAAPPGYGRVDAFGAILNEVFHQAVTDPAGEAGSVNTEAADAPVSYPCLWDTPQHDRVQWNGVAKNAGLGALGRNVGEVLGVFGDFEIPERPGITGYASSVRVLNLVKIEEWLKTLWSPRWPDAFPPIDPKKRDKGRLVYEKARCKDCHDVIDRKDPDRRITAVMTAVGTEARMADKFQNRTGSTGRLKGAFQNVVPWPPLSPKVIGATISGEDMLAHTVIGTIIGSGFQAPEDELSKIEYKRGAQAVLEAVPPKGGVYKARPLNGVWATAPYLHNGSVASLFQLLLPTKDRLKSFTVGTREFDPVNVGFRTDAPGFPVFEARSANGTPVPGNSNEGHEFGKELSDDERWQLVEYLKSL